MSIFEPEETVGVLWHRLVGGLGSWRRYPEAAATLNEMRTRLGIMFRASGGDGAIRLAESGPTASNHRLGLMRRLGLGTEKLELAALDDAVLRLPGSIDVFPDRADNEALYEWLALWFAHAATPELSGDPLRDDLLKLRAAVQVTRATLNQWPGLRAIYGRLRRATLAARPERALPPVEAEVEAAIAAILGGNRSGGGYYVIAIENPGLPLDDIHAPRGYRPYLPVPLWGEVVAVRPGAAGGGEEDGPGRSIAVDSKRRQAERRDTEQSDRGDPLLLHRFETIFSLSEMVNVNRKVDDDDEAGARQAAESLPDLTIGANAKRAATRLKLDLDLAPEDAAGAALTSGITYPEWDWKKRDWHRDQCRVLAGLASEEGEDWAPDAETHRRIAQVRRQFEALRPKREILHGQPDGDDLDLSALVRDVADRKAGGAGSERVFSAARLTQRDLSLAVLMDVSLSTDAWIGSHRVLDVEKAALLALAHGLKACGDEHAIFTFTSRRRLAVDIRMVKGFDEALTARVERRIAALKPGQYTRMGAAVRHVTAQLQDRPHRHRLLLLLTDGKPNDIDYYEGRYGIEDTRMAIREARKAGLRVFGVTVDEAARDYFPYIFGRGAYAIIPDAGRLPAALPKIYRTLTQ